MLDKLKFNNLVISNKKGIQQSRIQTINKLVHKIRKLQRLLEKKPDNSKCKERIRKSTETMEILKKLKKMEVMKQVLLMDKPAAAVITNGLANPEEVAVALLSMNKVMLGLVKRFKTELQLNDAENDEWKEALKESSKRKQKIERTEERRRKRLELKQQKVMGRKREEWLEENQPNIGEAITLGTDLHVSTTGAWQIDELSNDKSFTETNEEVQKHSKKESKFSIKGKPISNEASLLSRKHKFPNKMEPRNNKNECIEKSKSEASAIEGKCIKFDSEQSKKHKETEKDDLESLVVDPFFITDDGENYLSTAVINIDNLDEEKNNPDKRDLHMIKLNKYDHESANFNNRDRRRDKNQKNFGQNSVNKLKIKFEEDSRFTGTKYRNGKVLGNVHDKTRQIRPDSTQIKSANQDEKNLHPSWAAKQKLKPVITEFQGKKIRFEEEDSNKSSIYNKKFDKINQKSATQKSNNNEDSLHPSWAAKQKLKPSITVFQGKKIVFDNND